MIIGAHISRESTVIKTMEQIKINGGNALQIFTTNKEGDVSNIIYIRKYRYGIN
jgi:endonuclease IV